MAVIWRKKIANNSYEVRSAGASRRLYTNGVCHTQFNPKRVLTGSIWDLLLLPVFFKQPQQIQRVLVLGVGGGAVIRLLQHFLCVQEIQAVELDATHLYLAQRFFGVSGDNLYLHQSDAVEWVEVYSDEPFDLIIEDVFTDSHGQPVRAIAANSRWFKSLRGILNKEGILVMNFASQAEFRQSAVKQVRSVNHMFGSIFQLTMPTLDNHVGVYLQEACNSTELHQSLLKHKSIRRALESKYLSYRIRKQRSL